MAWTENNLTLTTTHGINLENHTNQFKVYFFSMQCEVQENNTLLLILVLWTHIKADLHEVLIWGADKALLIWGADLRCWFAWGAIKACGRGRQLHFCRDRKFSNFLQCNFLPQFHVENAACMNEPLRVSNLRIFFVKQTSNIK